MKAPSSVRTCPTSSRPRRPTSGVRHRHSGRTLRRRFDGTQGRLPCAQRKADGGLACRGRCAGRPCRRDRPHPRCHPEPSLHIRREAPASLRRQRRDRRTHRHPLRLLLAPHFGGFREEMDNVLLLDMAIHTFDAARYVAGRKPLTVYCVERNPKGSWYRHGASANAIFEFSDDIVFSYRGSGALKANAPVGKASGASSARRECSSGMARRVSRRLSPVKSPAFAWARCRKRSRSGTRRGNPWPRQRHRRLHRGDQHRKTARDRQFRQYQKPCHGLRRDRKRQDGQARRNFSIG